MAGPAQAGHETGADVPQKLAWPDIKPVNQRSARAEPLGNARAGIPAAAAYFLMPSPANFLLNLATWPPVSIIRLHAGPGRVRLRIDVQAQRVAWLAHAGPGLELCPVGHDDVNLVGMGVYARLHGANVLPGAADPDRPREGGAIAGRRASLKPVVIGFAMDHPGRSDYQVPPHSYRLSR